MTVQNQANIALNLKKQSALGTAASGSGGTQLEVTGGAGIDVQFASIVSNILKQNRQMPRPRQGSTMPTCAYETLAGVLSQNLIHEAVLGGTYAAAIVQTESTLTSCTISGTGVTLTMAAGNMISAGLRAGMMLKLSGMATAGNNGKWFPIISIDAATGRIITTAPGILVDETSDTAFTLTSAKCLYTPTPFVDSAWTVEENWADLDKSKLLQDVRFNTMQFSAAADQDAKFTFGGAGRIPSAPSGASAPVFTSPTLNAVTPLTLLDGGLYIGGVDRVDLTSIQAGITGPISGVPMLRTKYTPDVFVGTQAFAGQITGVLEDVFTDGDFAALLADTSLAMHVVFAQKNGVTDDFLSLYAGDVGFAGFATPAGGTNGGTIKTIKLNGGSDVRGTGFAPSTLVLSSSL